MKIGFLYYYLLKRRKSRENDFHRIILVTCLFSNNYNNQQITVEVCYCGTRFTLNAVFHCPNETVSINFFCPILPKGLRAYYGLVNNEDRENWGFCAILTREGWNAVLSGRLVVPGEFAKFLLPAGRATLAFPAPPGLPPTGFVNLPRSTLSLPRGNAFRRFAQSVSLRLIYRFPPFSRNALSNLWITWKVWFK